MSERSLAILPVAAALAIVVGATAANAMPAPPALETARVVLIDTPVNQMPPQMAHAYIVGIQEELALHGYRAGPADGAVGPQTQAAIRAYQRDAGLPVTGVATKELLDHLKFAQPKVFASMSSPGNGLDPALVRDVQIELAERGYYYGELDGIAGKGTRQAVRDFQDDAGLDVTGNVSRGLLDELRAAPPDLRAAPSI